MESYPVNKRVVLLRYYPMPSLYACDVVKRTKLPYFAVWLENKTSYIPWHDLSEKIMWIKSVRSPGGMPGGGGGCWCFELIDN